MFSNENLFRSEEDEKLDVIQPLAMKPIHQELSKPNKSPMVENPVKRRTTRRATIRILRENQNGKKWKSADRSQWIIIICFR